MSDRNVPDVQKLDAFAEQMRIALCKAGRRERKGSPADRHHPHGVGSHLKPRPLVFREWKAEEMFPLTQQIAEDLLWRPGIKLGAGRRSRGGQVQPVAWRSEPV